MGGALVFSSVVYLCILMALGLGVMFNLNEMISVLFAFLFYFLLFYDRVLGTRRSMDRGAGRSGENARVSALHIYRIARSEHSDLVSA